MPENEGVPLQETETRSRPREDSHAFCDSASLALLGPVDGSPGRVDASDERRPVFHFTPIKNSINDPNGLVFYAGEYHLFYQYNPEGDRRGHMSWGHAVSRDLVRWEHLPIALREEAGIMIFSGSAVFDARNTAGLARGDAAPLVAIYTGDGNKKQTQNLASSTDQGRTWTKFAGNLVLDLNSNSFRDPKVFWHKASTTPRRPGTTPRAAGRSGSHG
jgi:sucrose-6-phosphate hydrolase SacC (GH32 family)